jgi:energy-coupling factor transporter ATP-binding protein EcfA2/histidinol phosphatase-like PHP family hydrolase
MAGARFVRADLHVHLVADGDTSPIRPAADYIAAAIAENIEVLAITDHNSAAFVRDAMTAAAGKPILVLPGIEVSSRDGHLLAIFSPDRLDALEGFAAPTNLDLGRRLADGSRRSSRTMLHLMNEVEARHGFGIIAHCDRAPGIHADIKAGELAELISHAALAGVEFVDVGNLLAWFADTDADPARAAAWKARQTVAALRERGLARVLSSDAHDASLVGKDGLKRPLTRLRIGDRTYTSVRNALLFNPKSRVRIETSLPASYPHLTSATFEGGFLDGVTIDLVQNLNCLIGGRGSGKSTALLAIRAALGADLPVDIDPDDPARMPDRTIVRFVDSVGTERQATRDRGYAPADADGYPVELKLADLSQGESGQVALDYRSQRTQILTYLDSFCDLASQLDAEREVLERLGDNAAEVQRTAFRASDYRAAEAERAKLDANIKAAEHGQLEEIAKWARRLAGQAALIAQIRANLERVESARATAPLPRLDLLAIETQADLDQNPIKDLRTPLDEAITALNLAMVGADRAHATSAKVATAKVTQVIDLWDLEYRRWEGRRSKVQKDLEAKGLSVQVGAIQAMGTRLGALTKQLAEMEERRKQHTAALKLRQGLLKDLRECRRLIYVRRRATLRKVTARANESALDLRVDVSYVHEGVRRPWREWLQARFGFKADRLSRLARAIRSWEFAEAVATGDVSPIAQIKDTDGDGRQFFTSDDLDQIASLSWDERFEIETMRLEDFPRVDVTEGSVRRAFDHLSTGQQHSVLLSLLLCADRSDPLIIDQPEDHLDAPYIANAVVRHLEAAKERRQVIIATHNANLTVLGDAELVVPLYSLNGRGKLRDAGAIDHPDTLRHVCQLLEGGAGAYARRGQRYGFEVGPIPPDLGI